MRDADQREGGLLTELVRTAMKVSKKMLVVLLAVNICLLGYYLFKGYQIDFHSDAAAKNLLALEIWQTGQFFPADWNYVNGDLWVVFGQLFILPFVGWVKNGFVLHALSGVVTSALVLIGMWLVSGMVMRSVWSRLLIITIFAGGVSWVLAENLFGQGSYGSVLYMACFTLYFGWRQLHADGTPQSLRWGGALALVTLLTFWANPQRAIAYNAVPFFAGVFAYAISGAQLFEWRPGIRGWRATPLARRAALLMVFFAFGACFGIGLHAHFISGVNNIAGAGATRWLPFDGIVRNIGFTWQGLMSILGGIPPRNFPVFTAGGVYYGCRFLAAFLLLTMVPVRGVALLRSHDASMRMFAAFTLTSMALFLFVQVTTTTPDMTDPIISSRYLVPSMVMAMILVIATIENVRSAWAERMLALVIALALLSSPVASLNPMSRPFKGNAHDERISLIKELERRGLQYGYASYWNAGVLTVLSGQKVKIRQVELHRKLPQPHRHLSSNRWYRDSAWSGKTFLMMTDAEEKGLDWAAMQDLAGSPIEKFAVQGFVVYVYPKNFPRTELPGWQTTDDAYMTDLVIRMNAATSHTVGVLKSIGEAKGIESTQGESGYLHFGPYLRVLPGRYRATFDVVSEAATELGLADVVAAQGSNLMGSAKIKAGKTVIDFEVKRPVSDLELRVFTNGEAAVRLSGIELHKL